MVALSARLGTEMLIRNISSSRNESLRSGRANGPPRASVPQIAKPASRSATVAVSRWPRRSAAHSSGTIARKPSGSRTGVCSISGLKAIRPSTPVATRIAPDSRKAARLEKCGQGAAHRTITGVSTRAPARSPSHQVTQIGTKFAHAAEPARHSAPTPMVALSGVAMARQISANFATLSGVAKVSRPSDQRLTRAAPASASSVLPTAIAAAVAPVPVIALTRYAPIAIAGATRYPRSSTAASAKPVGGQIGLALGCSEASAKPTLASRKYPAVIAASSTA
jgi:hypothetical protein